MRIIQHKELGSRALENGEKSVPPRETRLEEVAVDSAEALGTALPSAGFHLIETNGCAHEFSFKRLIHSHPCCVSAVFAGPHFILLLSSLLIS
jgi:hypothetical protein